MSPQEIERRLLELAHTTDARLTAPALAYYAPCTLDEATRVLEELAGRDILGMDVEDDGTIVYHLRGRQRLPAPRATPAPTQLVPITHAPRGPSALVAMLLTLFLPGAGHLYAGRAFAAILWFLVVGLGYVLILPGLVLHLFAIASAARSAHRLDPGHQPKLLTGSAA